jgi:hypothetical protein
MSFRDLRRHAAETDEQPHDSMRAVDDRRRFLTRAAAGGAIAFGATMIPVATLLEGASAQTTAGTTAGTAAPGTTAAKKVVKPKIEGPDLTTFVFLQTIELAGVDLTKAIIDTGRLTNANAQTARDFAAHHQEHADKLATYLGSEALNVANPKLVFELAPKISAAQTEAELLDVAMQIEDGLTATCAYALGVLEGWATAEVVSTIMPVDSQQALVWSQLSEPDLQTWAKSITTYIPAFQSETGAFAPSKYAS